MEEGNKLDKTSQTTSDGCTSF